MEPATQEPTNPIPPSDVIETAITPQEDPGDIAYTITDPYFLPFRIIKSANAWWMDQHKVQKLIEVFKFGATIKEACIYAGITVRQYKYFVEIHPEFCTIKEACLLRLNLITRKTIVSNLETPAGAYWYAERKMRDEFGKDTQDAGNSQVARILDVIINQKGIQVSENTMRIYNAEPGVVAPAANTDPDEPVTTGLTDQI